MGDIKEQIKAIDGETPPTLEKLDKFSNHIGIAYQIKDDLQDFRDQHGKIEHKKPSILLSLLLEALPLIEKTSLQTAFETDNLEAIHSFIERFKINQQTEDLLRDYIDRAKTSLDNIQNLGLKLALHEILGKIFKDYI